jgi:hypothetical protein
VDVTEDEKMETEPTEPEIVEPEPELDDVSHVEFKRNDPRESETRDK